MDRGYAFSAELLRMMLSEERQKFISALENGTSWRELKRIRKNISEINRLLDSTNDGPNKNTPHSRTDDPGPR